MLEGFSKIFRAPFKSFDQFWVLIPLIIMWIILAVYFAKYKKEELGWNTALANGITLGWLTLEGTRSLFSRNLGDFWIRFTANMIILLYALLIIYFSFTHKISSKWDFILASPHPVYFLGIFSVMWGYGTLEINLFVLIDLLILFIVILIIIKILGKLVKPAKEENPPSPPSGSDNMHLFDDNLNVPPVGPKAGGGIGELPQFPKM